MRKAKKKFSSLQADDGTCRVVVCTSALGMGIDMKGVRTVVNFGSPDTAEEYLQAIGRADRDGSDSFGILLHSPSLSRGIGAGMKKFIRLSSGCRRQVLLSFFDHAPDATQRPHKCCDLCRRSCTCDTCSSGKLSMPVHLAKYCTEIDDVACSSDSDDTDTSDLEPLEQ